MLLASPGALAAPAPARVDVCFVPADPCEDRIIAAVDSARQEVLVQAYGFSSHPIIAALLRASTRGVDVRAVLDRSNEGGHRFGLDALRGGGVPVWIDRVSGIAHVKALIIDRHLVIGGSYNFTAAAQHRNVEDVTFTDSADLAERFRAEWASRQRMARPPAMATATATAQAGEPPMSAPPAGPQVLASDAGATARRPASAGPACAGDRLVWVNTRSRIYHFEDDRYFGATKQGKFACQRDADAEGDRPSQGR